jgi:hypothetical protein
MDTTVHLPVQSTSVDKASITVSRTEQDVLRRLAEKVRALSERPQEREKRDLWYKHNDLVPVRPLIFCDPEEGWCEIITEDQMHCHGDLARRWEMTLRKEIFWGESMGDDRVIEPTFDVAHVYTESDWGMHETKIQGENRGSYCWESPLKSYDQLHTLRFPVIVVDPDSSELLLQTARDTLGDILQVRQRTKWWWSLGMTERFVYLRGLGQMMMDVYDHPDEVKRFMAFLRDGNLAKLDFLQQNGLLAPNHDNVYVGSGGFGYTKQLPKPGYDGTHVGTSDMWGFSESQETTGISPAMFGEFVYAYQRPLLERFGLNCYGCCEPLHGRWRYIKDTPNLRRVSVSAWADRERMAEYLQDQFIYSFKPNPAYLAVPELMADAARAELRQVIEAAKDCHLEIIMKDNHTLGGNPHNAVEWCRMAREEIARRHGKN